MIERTLDRLPARPVRHFRTCTRPTPGARAAASVAEGRDARELGAGLRRLRAADHPARAGTSWRPRPWACGWSASRCSSRPRVRKERGETEYAMGAIPRGRLREDHRHEPLGGAAREVAHRAYYRQPVWKRIVVIPAGPAMNVAAGVPDPVGLVRDPGLRRRPAASGQVEKAYPRRPGAAPGGRLVAVDGGAATPRAARADRHPPLPGRPGRGLQAADAGTRGGGARRARG